MADNPAYEAGAETPPIVTLTGLASGAFVWATISRRNIRSRRTKTIPIERQNIAGFGSLRRPGRRRHNAGDNCSIRPYRRHITLRSEKGGKDRLQVRRHRIRSSRGIRHNHLHCSGVTVRRRLHIDLRRADVLNKCIPVVDLDAHSAQSRRQSPVHQVGSTPRCAP